jgi:hypothetical protein
MQNLRAILKNKLSCRMNFGLAPSPTELKVIFLRQPLAGKNKNEMLMPSVQESRKSFF